jgi:hypothetical protein
MLARMVAAQRAPGSPAAFTEREYLALESVAETRHEFVGGQILGMAGAEPEHNQIVHNLHVALDLALRARRCRIAGADQRVRIEATGDYVYPDVVVTCAEARYVEPAPRSLTNPTPRRRPSRGPPRRASPSSSWLPSRPSPSSAFLSRMSSMKRRGHDLPREAEWVLDPAALRSASRRPRRACPSTRRPPLGPRSRRRARRLRRTEVWAAVVAHEDLTTDDELGGVIGPSLPVRATFLISESGKVAV